MINVLLLLITLLATSCVAHSTLSSQERDALLKEKGTSAAEKFLETNMALLGFRSNVKIDVDQTVHANSDDRSYKNKNSNNNSKQNNSKNNKSERSETAQQSEDQPEGGDPGEPESSIQPGEIAVLEETSLQETYI